MIKVSNIKWSKDGQHIALPSQVTIKGKDYELRTNEDVTNFLSDKHGFLIESLKISREIESITVAQLIKALEKLPAYMKVFIASDSECNSYSSMSLSFGPFGVFEDRKSIWLQPFEDHLEWEQVDTKSEEAMAKWEKEHKLKNK